MPPKSLFDRVWAAHQVRPETAELPGITYIDLHLLHEVTSPQGFTELKRRGMRVRRPDRHVATLDHSTPTLPPNARGEQPFATSAAANQVRQLQHNCAEHGIELHGFDSQSRGIVHVMGPELGLTRPGMTIVCGDSHTTTHGAFGALAFGIGSSQVGHVLATQCILMRRPKSMLVRVDGKLPQDASAKDLALHFIRKVGVGGATGHVIEYTGSAVRALDMEQRMTLANLSIEAGARAGMISPDQTTIDYLRDRCTDLNEREFAAAAKAWLALASDEDATFDREVVIDAAEVSPMVTWGTNPAMAAGINEPVPTPASPVEARAQSYMQVVAGRPLRGTPIQKVFIGSCTNGRLSDLRQAADVMKGRRVAPSVTMIVVPGSEAVRTAAEAEGLADIFRAAGAQWRLPGCSMCIAMNGDRVAPGELAVSTSNRNFEGRQGPGSRTILSSPAVAAASAVAGCVANPADVDQQEVA